MMAGPGPGDEFAGIGPLDTAPIGPINDPPHEPDNVETALEELSFVRHLGDEPDRDTYGELVRELDRETLSVDERNDLGCAWAWLAHLDDDFGLWSLAIGALERSVAEATSDEQKDRAGQNLEHVDDALRATGGAT